MATEVASPPTIAVLGAGSWGTVFSTVLEAAGARVHLWARRPEVAHEINQRHTNTSYLPGLTLGPAIRAFAEVGQAIEGVDGIVLAVPAQSLRGAFAAWPTLPDVPVLSLIKGIEQGTDLRISELMTEVGGIGADRIAVLSGPNLAGEIAQQQPCASVVASSNADVARTVATWCRAPWFRTYVSEDVIGVEVAGAMKNVIATAVGAAAGLGYGDNSRASLITRGLAEMSRMGTALGASPATFAGLAGMGDLVATCASPLSRNFRLGRALGEGMSLEAATVAVGQTAEGVATARAIAEVATAKGIDVPITSALVDVIDHGRDIADVTTALLSRSVRAE